MNSTRSPASPPGHRMFARYAHAPDSLGYCDPESAALLRVESSTMTSRRF